MLKTTTTVKAKDTTSAMEKVITELGEDCVILSTKKNNGMIEMTASNLNKHKSAVKKRYDKEKFSNIYNLKSGKSRQNINPDPATTTNTTTVAICKLVPAP